MDHLKREQSESEKVKITDLSLFWMYYDCLLCEAHPVLLPSLQRATNAMSQQAPGFFNTSALRLPVIPRGNRFLCP